MANKIKYGISNCYYAVATTNEQGETTYSTPVALKGAVNLTLDQNGESNEFYADNILYWQGNSNNGYTGSLELARIPDSFYQDVLGFEKDATNGVEYEKTGTPTIEFALLFQFEGDESATRHLMYRCTASRPSVNGATVEASITPQTETIDIVAMPRISDSYIKAKADADASAYTNWFNAVVLPPSEESETTETTETINDGE